MTPGGGPDDGLWLEDVEEGARYTTAEHEVTEDEVLSFARDFDPQAAHLDAAAARGTFFGGLVASGWHTAAISMRLNVTSGMPLANGWIGGHIEADWPTPTLVGDLLRVELAVREVRPSRSKPDRGMVVVDYETLNQHGEVRQRTTAHLLVFRRPEPTVG
jgi:acyl dehydratase